MALNTIDLGWMMCLSPIPDTRSPTNLLLPKPNPLAIFLWNNVVMNEQIQEVLALTNRWVQATQSRKIQHALYPCPAYDFLANFLWQLIPTSR